MKKMFLSLIISAIIPFATYANIDEGTCGTCKWVISDDGTLTISPIDGVEGTLANWDNRTDEEKANHVFRNYTSEDKHILGCIQAPWMGEYFEAHKTDKYGNFHESDEYTHSNDIKKVRFEGKVNAVTCLGMFTGTTMLTDVDLSGLNTDNVTDMSSMFFTSAVPEVDLTVINTSNVEYVSGMFSFCYLLTNLDLTNSSFRKVKDDGYYDFCLDSGIPINMPEYNIVTNGLNINIWNENPTIFTDGETTVYGHTNFFRNYIKPGDMEDTNSAVYADYYTAQRIIHFPLNMTEAEAHYDSSLEYLGVNGVAMDLQLTDGEVYSRKHDLANCRIPYVRNFKNTNWQALYVPFSVQYTKCDTDEPTYMDYEIAEIGEYVNPGDGQSPYVTATKLTSGYTEPNKAYFIKAKTTGKQVLYARSADYVYNNTGVTMCENDENTRTVGDMTFGSTYNGLTNGEMYNNGYYGLINGELRKASSTSVTLGTYRWYATLPTNAAKALTIQFSDGTVDTIDATELDIFSDNEPIYNLSGQRVCGNLLPGVYVKGGKKFMVK